MLNFNGDFDGHGNGDVMCKWNFIDYEVVKGKNFAHGLDQKHSFPGFNAWVGGESEDSIACKWEDTHPGFQTRRHQKCKIRVSVAPQKRLMSSI